MPGVRNSHFNPTDFPSLETFPHPSSFPTCHPSHPIIFLWEVVGFQGIQPTSMQICWYEASCLHCSSPAKNYNTKGRTMDVWPFPLFTQLQAKWVFGNTLSDPLRRCKAKLWSRSRLEGREGVWEKGAYRGVVFAGGQLAVKIRKVKITGRGGWQEGGKHSCDDIHDVCSYLGHVRSRCSSRQSAAASSDPVEEWWRALLTWEKS